MTDTRIADAGPPAQPRQRRRALPRLAGIGLALAASIPAAKAQSIMETEQRAQGLPLADPASIVTIQIENDAASTLSGTSDQYYTSGIRLGYVSPTGEVPKVLADAGRYLWGNGVDRFTIDISQSLFTPRDTQVPVPLPNDHPYAGELLLTGGLIHDTASTRNLFALSLGVVGPDAQGARVQNGFHDIIGDTENQGWHSEIQDQVAVELLEQHTWRVPIAQFYGLETDGLPSLSVAGGSVQDYVGAGLRLRLGQGLSSDFGPAKIQPGVSGTDAYTPSRPFVWYAFGGVDGRLVGYDVALDGSTFRRNTPSVHRIFDVGEMEAGVAVMYYGVRISYTQTWQTPEFDGSKGGLFNYGSLALSARF